MSSDEADETIRRLEPRTHRVPGGQRGKREVKVGLVASSRRGPAPWRAPQQPPSRRCCCRAPCHDRTGRGRKKGGAGRKGREGSLDPHETSGRAWKTRLWRAAVNGKGRGDTGQKNLRCQPSHGTTASQRGVTASRRDRTTSFGGATWTIITSKAEERLARAWAQAWAQARAQAQAQAQTQLLIPRGCPVIAYGHSGRQQRPTRRLTHQPPLALSSPSSLLGPAATASPPPPPLSPSELAAEPVHLRLQPAHVGLEPAAAALQQLLAPPP